MMKSKRIIGDIGRCIYCGITGIPLSEEHIIPYGLGGRFVLKNASCQKCATITSVFELNVLRSQFGSARALLNLPTRGKHQQEFSSSITKKFGGEETIQSDAKEFGSLKIFPVFSPPGFFLTKFKKQNPFPKNALLDWCLIFSGGLSMEEFSKKYGADRIRRSIRCNPFDFARMVAKIAYGFSIGVLGIDNIKEVYVLPLILKETDDAGTFVGCDIDGIKSSSNDIIVIVDVKRNEIIVKIKLFGREKSPTYLVMVGKTKPFRLFFSRIFKFCAKIRI